MRAILSLMALYNYDPDLFTGFNYPSKWTAEEQETFINNLIFDTAELEVLYPDPDIMNAALRVWSRSQQPNWDKLYDTTKFDYNPIWNKDGIISESETIKRDNSYQDDRSGTGENHDTTTNNLKQTNTSAQNTETNTRNDTAGNTLQKDYVFGFNSSDAAQSEQHENNNSQNATGNGTEKININGEQANTGTSQNDGRSANNETLTHTGNDNEGREYKRVEQGNIGITTTQQMIREEREVDKFNLMDYIIDSFKQRFCLMVY